jgi:hypothetical protein
MGLWEVNIQQHGLNVSETSIECRSHTRKGLEVVAEPYEGVWQTGEVWWISFDLKLGTTDDSVRHAQGLDYSLDPGTITPVRRLYKGVGASFN